MPKGNRLKLTTDDRNHSSYRYKKWQRDVGGFNCVLCGKGYYNTLEIRLETHHIWAMATYPHLAFNPKNGIVLCHDCHIYVHNAMRAGTLTEIDIFTIKTRYLSKIAESFALQLKHLAEKW